MNEYATETPEVLREKMREKRIDATLVVPSALVVPVATGLDPDAARKQADEFFADLNGDSPKP